MHDSLHKLHLSNSFAQLPEVFYSRLSPTPFIAPARLVHFNVRAAAMLGLDPAIRDDAEFLAVMSGRRDLPGGDPLAMLYAGHQFGHYVPQLGDGRAIVLGELMTQQGMRWELQLKGSGRTPYSRQGDGRAVLRSTIREYLCSEAMHGLGIPTMQALCMVESDDPVFRETVETGAMLTRLAPSHVRFGSFEVFFYRGEHAHLRTLADYVIALHYPELRARSEPYLALLEAVVERTAKLIARWQSVGFAHGVMNTDNMSILGLTLDYGPFGFMEAFDPGFICNHSDHRGRYAFERQGQIGLWNLTCLAQALSPLIDIEAARAALARYEDIFINEYSLLMARKLGFELVDEAAAALANELLEQMQQSRADYTLSFRALCDVGFGIGENAAVLRDRFVDRERFDRWLADYRERLRAAAPGDAARRIAMRAVNPKYVLRNYLAQVAIEKARQGDYSEIDRLMRILQSPYDEHPGRDVYAEPAPAWADQLEVSCSS
jgi:uncharacterized protein YdiU (UPF0061 family)